MNSNLAITISDPYWGAPGDGVGAANYEIVGLEHDGRHFNTTPDFAVIGAGQVRVLCERMVEGKSLPLHVSLRFDLKAMIEFLNRELEEQTRNAEGKTDPAELD